MSATRRKKSVRLRNAALDDWNDGEIVVRGVIDPEDFQLLKVAEYQREVAPRATIEDLAAAFQDRTAVPDIELGLRGQRHREEENGTIVLLDDVYLIDGLQRCSAAQHAMDTHIVERPRLGAMVHFDSTEAWERNRFRILNSLRTKVSSNVLLKNARHEHASMAMLWKLSRSPQFVLKGRIQWGQRRRRDELLTALTVAKVLGFLHSRFGPGRSNQWLELSRALDTTMERVGPRIMRQNLINFFNVVDECWGVKRITYTESAVHMRVAFLLVLATIFYRHSEFWTEEGRLEVKTTWKRKLSKFNVFDPSVVNLAGSGGKSSDMLYEIMIKHINSGRRTRRLVADYTEED